MFKGYSPATAAPTLPGGTLAAAMGIATAGSWLGGASGNIDTDTTMDEWVITTDPFTATAGDDTGNKASGEPVNTNNDVNR